MAAANRLAGETSPYLLQHADNPVHWQPWDEAALAEARREDLPILLSIGYSACHWCHVMAHESFEDDETAALMNALFVCIKVDREERPDLDHIYQTLHQVLNREAGGWPLTTFLDPQSHLPFFSGTYFPPRPAYGRPGFPDLLRQVAAFHQQKRASIQAQEAQLQPLLRQLEATPGEPAQPDADTLERAVGELRAAYDPAHGGFSGAPKFPMPASLEFLLAAETHVAPTEPSPRTMALATLFHMACGGLFDHLGGGFCRYSTDARWRIPHFEKMLYDNGALLGLYGEAAEAGQLSLFSEVAQRTVDWVLGEMRAPGGAFCASLDADSEGGEGAYYVWDRDAVKALLDEAEFPAFAEHYGLNEEPNFEGRWHLYLSLPRNLPVPGSEDHARLESARRRLLGERRQRPAPGRDDKVLASWNGLMISGLARAGAALQDTVSLDAAAEALDFVRENLWVDGRLHATWKDGRARFNACLDDHAFLLQAALDLLESRWRDTDLDFARQLASTMLDGFAAAGGGFHFTSHDHEQLAYRPMDLQDDAMPSGNGVAARALLRLGHLCAEPAYLDAARRTLEAAWPTVTQAPAACCSLLHAALEYLHPPLTVLLRGNADDLEDWVAACRKHAGTTRHYLVPPGCGESMAMLSGAGASGAPVAVVCSADRCHPPVHGLQDLVSLLDRLAAD